MAGGLISNIQKDIRWRQIPDQRLLYKNLSIEEVTELVHLADFAPLHFGLLVILIESNELPSNELIIIYFACFNRLKCR